MEKKYNRDNIDSNLSMGECALFYYEDISVETVMNRIIVSTILQLHLKGFVELNENDEKKLIIKIKSSTIQLKPSEIFIYECLKSLDMDNNSVLTLDEFNISSTRVFARNKRQIKKMIIQEALEDNLITVEKYQQKRKIFFRSLRILLLIIFTIILSNMKILSLLFCFLLSFLGNPPSYSKNSLNNISKHSKNDDGILMHNYQINFNALFFELAICLCICFFNIYSANSIFISINPILLYCIEMIIALIFAIVAYIKFKKFNVFTDKAQISKQNLNGLEEFLKDYSLIENKKSLEIHIWEDYLAFSVLLGINQNIADELKVNLKKVTQIRYYDYYENRYKYMYK